MELEIGSPHKSLQSVVSLVWPRTVPRLRSLSTEQSRAKHIFIDCVCMCLLGSEVNMCMRLFGQGCMHERFFGVRVCAKQKAACRVHRAQLSNVRRAAVSLIAN